MQQVKNDNSDDDNDTYLQKCDNYFADEIFFNDFDDDNNIICSH